MALRRLSLTPAEAATLGEAFRALQRGETKTALAGAQRVLADAPDAPDALHLLALALRDNGDMAGAENAFKQALASAPRHIDLLNNYAGLLQRTARMPEAIAQFRAALALNANRSDIWTNLALAQSGSQDSSGAVQSAQRALALKPDSPRALRALATALRATGDFPGAEAALRKAVAIEPNNGESWTALGVLRRVLGDPHDAMACYKKARATGFSAPELADAEASAYLDAGDVPEAIKRAEALTATAPAYVPGHVLLAHLRWENRDPTSKDDPLAALEQAVSAQPDHAELRLALVNTLLDAQQGERALPHVRALRQQKDSAPAVMAHALALEQMGELTSAIAVVDAALPAIGVPQGLGGSFARLLLRAREPARAAKFAQMDVDRDPTNQNAWAMLSTAWRLLDDPRELWLCAYEQFVMCIDIEPPPGYADQAAFISALSATLNALHVAKRAPINQSLRGGTQTPGDLLGRPDPVLAATKETLLASIRTLIASLPRDDAHPFLRRNAGDVRFNGSWSVRLQSSGAHVNHFHSNGWLSSAFYVQLPPSVTSGDAAHPGWIQFGQPPAHLQTNLSPRRVVQPVVGRLVLFPSYMWHGTVPFADDATRVTVAFDAIPV